jgi:hypothetical protein
VPEKANDKSNSKNKSDKDAGHRTPGGVATRIQRPPTTKPHHRNLGRNKKSSNSLPIGHAAEGLSITDSFGANSVSSALDHSAKRDPGGASINSSCNLSR